MDLLRSLMKAVLPATVAGRPSAPSVTIPVEKIPSMIRAALATGQPITATVQAVTQVTPQGQQVQIALPQGGAMTVSVPANFPVSVGSSLIVQTSSPNAVTIQTASAPVSASSLPPSPSPSADPAPTSTSTTDWIFTQRGERTLARYGPAVDQSLSPSAAAVKSTAMLPALMPASDISGLVLRIEALSLPALRLLGITPGEGGAMILRTRPVSAAMPVDPRTVIDGAGLLGTDTPDTLIAVKASSTASASFIALQMNRLTRLVPPPPTGPTIIPTMPAQETTILPAIPPRHTIRTEGGKTEGRESGLTVMRPTLRPPSSIPASPPPMIMAAGAAGFVRVLDQAPPSGPLPPAAHTIPVGAFAARVVAVDSGGRLVLSLTAPSPHAAVPASAFAGRPDMSGPLVVTSLVSNPPAIGADLILHLMPGKAALSPVARLVPWAHQTGPSMELTHFLNTKGPTAFPSFPAVMLPGVHPDPGLAAPLVGLVLGAMARGTLSDLVRSKGLPEAQRTALAQTLSDTLDEVLSGTKGTAASMAPIPSTDNLGADFKSHLIPLVQDGAVHIVALHVRDHPGRDPHTDGERSDTRPAIRFVFDLQLDRMGAVQLDGLYVRQGQARMMEMTLRTECALEANARDHLRALYAHAMALSGTVGELHFQGTPDRFVIITPMQAAGAAQEWRG